MGLHDSHGCSSEVPFHAFRPNTSEIPICVAVPVAYDWAVTSTFEARVSVSTAYGVGMVWIICPSDPELGMEKISTSDNLKTSDLANTFDTTLTAL